MMLSAACRSKLARRSVCLTIAVMILSLHHQVFADTLPPGLNTPQGVTNLSIAVENNVGLTLSQPPANSPPGTPPNVAVPGTMTMKNITISDQTEVLGNSCPTPGMLAEDSNFNLLICQQNATGMVWNSALGQGSCTQYNLTGYYAYGQTYPIPSSTYSYVLNGPLAGTPGGYTTTTVSSGTILASPTVQPGAGGGICNAPGIMPTTELYQCQNGQWVGIAPSNYVSCTGYQT